MSSTQNITEELKQKFICKWFYGDDGDKDKFISDFDALLEPAVNKDKENPYYPFASESEWLDYNNQHTETLCNIILNYKGNGKFGGDKVQQIADIVLNATTNNIDYEIDFSGFVKAKFKIINNKIEVTAAMNGYGDMIPLDQIKLMNHRYEKI